MPTSLCRRIITVLLLLTCTCQVYSQNNDAGVVFLKDISHVKLRPSSLIRTDTVEILIRDKRGDNFSHVTIPYSKGDNVKINYAWIEDSDGNIVRKLKKQDVGDASYLSDVHLYSDNFKKYFQLRHNVYPYKVVYSYTITQNKYLHAAGAGVYEKVPVENGVLVVEFPEGMGIRHDYENVNAPVVSAANGVKRYEWRYSYKPVRRQVLSPEESLGKPRITVVPEKIDYGAFGEFTSWEAFGNWYYRLNDNLRDLPESERRTVDRITTGLASDYDKAKALYYYLQDNHRYISVSVDLGGFRSYPARYVCENRYGDCKALTNYMKALLSYAGIESHFILVNSGSGRPRDLKESFARQAFNHVILLVPIGQDTIYLECTSKNEPFGYISTSIQGRQGLLCVENGSRLVRIPAQEPEDVERGYEYDIKLKDNGGARVNITAVLKGAEFESINYGYYNLKEKYVQEYIADNFFTGSYTFNGYDISKGSRDDDNITINASADFNGYYKIYGNNILINGTPIRIVDFEKPSDRTSGVRINYPSNFAYILKYDLGKYKIAEVPAAVYIESSYGRYSVVYSMDDNLLVIEKRLTLFAGDYPIDDYEDFYSFISTIKKKETSKLNFNIL